MNQNGFSQVIDFGTVHDDPYSNGSKESEH